MINRKNKGTMDAASEQRFLDLIAANQDKMYRIAFSYVKNKEDALDVVQESVYKGYISYHKVKEKSFETTWLVRIVINTAIDLLRRNNKVVPLVKEVNEPSGEEMEKTVGDKLLLRAAMDNLNDIEKSVITLRFFEDMILKDIADVLEKPLSTIKTTLYRALEKMKIELTEVEL